MSVVVITGASAGVGRATARAIVWAAEHTPREMSVGFTTVLAIHANKFGSRLIDWYLSKVGIKSQQMSAPDDPLRPNNLWSPVPGDAGAHGDFDDRSRESSPQLWGRMHLKDLALLSLSGVVIGGFLRYRGSKKKRRCCS